MATIKAIEGRSVHQIQSGQVIVDLCSVVKELVENSLDAGATSIDVRFKGHGLDAIEVQDNGSGIAPEDFETVALKHYTSKLSSYDDLTSLRTFGFRGEALSSLCALSDFHITTARAGEAPRGNRLDYEHSGKLKERSVIASQKGTTISVEGIFRNLPVRRKELAKNIKREYGKALGLLQAYACVSTGVKFTVSNQAAKSNKVVAFSTKANPSTRENITNVYGAKTTLQLVALDLRLEMEPSTGTGTQSVVSGRAEDGENRTVRIKGHISRPVVGEGRQTPDRQMFFVNSRPCALPQVAKAFNEVYRSYNVTQSPFIFADLHMNTNAYDVNVSPDKRSILLHDQTALLESLKDALVELFDKHDQSVPQASLVNSKLPTFKAHYSNKERLEAVENVGQDSDKESGQGEANPPTATVSTPGRPRSHAKKVSEPKSNVISRERQNDPTVLPSAEAEKRKSLERSRPVSPTFISARDLARDQPEYSSEDRVVADFNARIASQKAKSDTRKTLPGHQHSTAQDKNKGRVLAEEEIQSIKPGIQDRSPGPVQTAFDRMRPKRNIDETATVTIGDTTTHVTLGAPPKRRAIHIPKIGLDGRRLSQGGPLASKGLRQFAAPGTEFDDGSDNASELQQKGGMEESPELDDQESHSDVPMDDVECPRERDGIEAMSDEESHVPSDERGVQPLSEEGEDSDGEYLNSTEKRRREEERVAKLIARAEEEAARPSEDNIKRATNALRSRQRKDSTLQLTQNLSSSVSRIEQSLNSLTAALQSHAEEQRRPKDREEASLEPAVKTAEERLSLTVSKSDFADMRIVGQFNLGFIVALRPGSSGSSQRSNNDELFIIDQHAADEKYNFERLAANTIVQNQRLVRPRTLELTAVEEEIILSHPAALTQNGFQIETDTSGDKPVGRRCKLVGLPTSKEVVFDVSDLEELVALLGEDHAGDAEATAGSHSNISTSDYENINNSSLDADFSTPAPGQQQQQDRLRKTPSSKSATPVARPSKVRRLLAMRACRSSIMVGRTLTKGQMKRVVANMGEMDKPWNCPHGRPTMRHLFGLDGVDQGLGWREGMGVVGLGGEQDEGLGWKWAQYARENKT